MIRELTSEQAREIALQGTDELNKHLEIVFNMIAQEARQSRFHLRYHTEGTADIIYPLRERLLLLGYDVESCSGGRVDFIIRWK
jgi:hypothetical protein